MLYKNIVDQLSQDLNLPSSVIENAYKSYWFFIRTTIKDLPLKEDLSEEKFNKLQTSFNIPSIGKLSCTFDRVMRIKRIFAYIKNVKEKNDKSKEN